MSNLVGIMRRMHHHMLHYAQFPALFREIVPISNGHSGRRKSGLTVVLDLLYCFFVLRMVPRNYYLFGFHMKPRCEFRNYMDESNSPVLKRRLYETLWPAGYCSLVNDKYVFHCLCCYHHIPVPEVYGICANGIVRENGKRLEEVMEREHIGSVILKPVKGLQGKGIYFASSHAGTLVMRSANSPSAACETPLPDDEYIIQEIIEQHPELNRVNPHCLNSLRVITILTPGNNVKVLAAMLRTSSGRSPVDNFSLGGIVVGVDLENGVLSGTGFMKGRQISMVTRHPVTGLLFQGFRVPYWTQVKDAAIRAQRVFGVLKAVGWDISVSPRGPVMIEGNIEWGTTGIQAANGGLLTPENRALFAGYGLRFYG